MFLYENCYIGVVFQFHRLVITLISLLPGNPDLFTVRTVYSLSFAMTSYIYIVGLKRSKPK